MADTTILAIKGMPAHVAERFRRGARARNITQAEYLDRLLDLHDQMRALADSPTSDGRWQQVATELEALGLQTVSG